MKTVSDLECERMFTTRIVLENRWGEQVGFEEATKYTVDENGEKTVAYFPSDNEDNGDIREQEVETFGLDWKVVSVRPMNVPEENQSN